ncbi:GNAT family N-acetyltransferase [Mycolicibacterium sp. J2]|jgi:RimJ/RimL family protein N-acetyltransferase|uniref:GNAT family N-acetyltransferase n=1 Tax=Mycolicibacterium sp. J2 TaxID=2993511 RepID=UPI00224ACA89|nr:GNAT family N-acetyltransferase [Mycolicibacterium sp. J2]MCX2715878.1 GNAT family N-acetyltransferase [Mycolicibacterium sp. J2]
MADGSTVSAARIEGERVVLRMAHRGDVEGLVEIQVDAAVRRFLGGPRPEGEVREAFASVGAAGLLPAAGSYVVADKETDEMFGTVVLDRRSWDVPGHLDEGESELELSYVFRRHAWGRGLADEAARAVLQVAAAELVDQPVLVVTQTANHASLRLAERLGFRVVDTFEQWGAPQVLATARLHAFRVE